MNRLERSNSPNGAAGATVLWGAFLLFLSALPDAMVVPVLRQLIVDRYEVSVGAAHAFMWVNLLGAIAVVGWVELAIRKLGTRNAVVIAALTNGGLLMLLAAPIGFIPMLAVRAVEGGADVAVYASLFHAISRAGAPETKGRRMGGAATAMMLGISAGVGLGGQIGAFDALACLWVGGLVCGGVAVLALNLRAKESTTHSKPAVEPAHSNGLTSLLWPPLVMMFIDRAVASLLAATASIYFASSFGLSSRTSGVLIGSAMLMIAVGAYPAGFVVDRFGPLVVRLGGGLIYAGGMMLIPFVVDGSMFISLPVLLAVGGAGAGLFAASLTMIAHSRHGARGMAAYHASGNVGFLMGAVTASIVLTLLGGDEPAPSHYAAVFIGFGAVHLLVNVMVLIAASIRIRLIAPNQPAPMS